MKYKKGQVIKIDGYDGNYSHLNGLLVRITGVGSYTASHDGPIRYSRVHGTPAWKSGNFASAPDYCDDVWHNSIIIQEVE